MGNMGGLADRTVAIFITCFRLELGGSNHLKNLWPPPDEPPPGWGDKDQLENELHAEVCSEKLTLADAQHCISSRWVHCWQQHVVPEYGTAAASSSR
jgi:hypothetical protein